MIPNGHLKEGEPLADRYFSYWEAAEDSNDMDYGAHSVYQVITSPINQMGKTTFALRQMEVLLERLHSRKLDLRNVHFTVPDFLARRLELAEWDQQVLDEPQRAASNKTSWSEANLILAENLMTNNYLHKHAFLPTPHNHFVDSAVVNVCTSQAVIKRKGTAYLYFYDRDQLNRSIKPKTPSLGWVTFEKPSAEIWLGYCKMRDEFNLARSLKQVELLRKLENQAGKISSDLSEDDLADLVIANPSDYIATQGKMKGLISGSIIKAKLSTPDRIIPYNRAQQAATKARLRLKQREDIEEAEEEAV